MHHAALNILPQTNTCLQSHWTTASHISQFRTALIAIHSCVSYFPIICQVTKSEPPTAGNFTVATNRGQSFAPLPITTAVHIHMRWQIGRQTTARPEYILLVYHVKAHTHATMIRDRSVSLPYSTRKFTAKLGINVVHSLKISYSSLSVTIFYMSDILTAAVSMQSPSVIGNIMTVIVDFDNWFYCLWMD